MLIKAVTGGYAGGGELWFMSESSIPQLSYTTLPHILTMTAERQQSEWRKRNPEKVAKYNERHKEWQRQAYAANPDYFKKQNRESQKRMNPGIKIAAMEHYNPNGKAECATCGERALVVLTLSHLAPTPEWDRLGGKHLYRKLKKEGYPKLPLLTECMNCNVKRDNWGRGFDV